MSCENHVQIVNTKFSLAFGYDEVVQDAKSFIVQQFGMENFEPAFLQFDLFFRHVISETLVFDVGQFGP